MKVNTRKLVLVNEKCDQLAINFDHSKFTNLDHTRSYQGSLIFDVVFQHMNRIQINQLIIISAIVNERDYCQNMNGMIQISDAKLCTSTLQRKYLTNRISSTFFLNFTCHLLFSWTFEAALAVLFVSAQASTLVVATVEEADAAAS